MPIRLRGRGIAASADARKGRVSAEVIAAARRPIGPPSPRQHEKCAYERHRFIEVHIERKGMRLAGWLPARNPLAPKEARWGSIRGLFRRKLLFFGGSGGSSGESN